MKILYTVAIALLVSGCVSTTRPVVTTGDFGPETLTLINSYREGRSLSPLASHGTLRALARQHSQYQAARNDISHDGFRQRSAQAKAAGLVEYVRRTSVITIKMHSNLFQDGRTPQPIERICFGPTCAMQEFL